VSKEKPKLPTGIKELPKGVEINGSRLRIHFMYRGARCREPMPGKKITAASIKYAGNKRLLVVTEIAEGKFDYVAHFPESKRALAFAGEVGTDPDRTVKQGVDRWLTVQKEKRASSTIINYTSKANHVLAWKGPRKIRDVSKSDLELFQASLLKQGLAPKTVNDIFTIVRGVWADAFGDGIIKANPLDRITNIQGDDEQENADPFTRDEIDLIAAADPSCMPNVRMILFNCWAGLSVSEIIALGRDDIDQKAGGVWVRRARVISEYKVPKERSRLRFVELIDPALDLLDEILKDSAESAPQVIAVTQRDNITQRTETVQLLFRNCISGLPWTVQSVRTWFSKHLKLAGVRHRGANQCRHTFASQALSSYVPVEWVARQLGHTDTTMVRKHYGRWIPADTKSMAGLVSQMMGFRGSGAEASREVQEEQNLS